MLGVNLKSLQIQMLKCYKILLNRLENLLKFVKNKIQCGQKQ